jgi:hypothetical protein
MISLVSRLKIQYRPLKIYVDASKPDFIKSLKSMFNEALDIGNYRTCKKGYS